jgi:hypothetical protein
MDDKRTGIYASSLTNNDIINALYSRRTFSSEDKNANIWMEFDGHHMGRFAGNGNNSQIRIKLSDPDGETWNYVDVVGSNNSNPYSHGFSFSSVDTTISINTTGLTWIFIRAQQPDGDYIWSAPVFLSPSASAQESESRTSVEVFPNPAKDHITIRTNNKCSVVTIYDVNGKAILSETKNSPKFDINVEQFENGIYFIKITTEKETNYSKIIIQR